MRTKYVRTCNDCGDVKTVGYKPKGHELCVPCSGKKLGKEMSGKNIKTEDEKKKYLYFCPFCPAIITREAKKKTSLCGDCSRIHSKRMKRFPTKIYYDMIEDKVVVIETPRVISTKIKKKKTEDVQKKPKKVKKPKDNKVVAFKRKMTSGSSKVSSAAIEREREKNRQHKENIKDVVFVKEVVQRKTDSEMKREFLKNNKPSVAIDDSESIPHFFSGDGLGTRTSVMS